MFWSFFFLVNMCFLMNVLKWFYNYNDIAFVFMTGLTLIIEGNWCVR